MNYTLNGIHNYKISDLYISKGSGESYRSLCA